MNCMFVLICIGYTTSAIKMNRFEQRLRRKYDVNYDPNEINFDGSGLVKLLAISFGGGWVSGALGLGGGSIYNPCLLAMGVHPKVSGATGMYLVMFSAINSCTVNWLQHNLNFEYGLWLGILASAASMCGLFFADLYVKRTGKQSVFVWLLCVIFFMTIIVTPATVLQEQFKE